MAWPPSLSDFYALGMSPAACVPDTRTVKSVNVGGQLFELPTHGLFGGETIYFQAGTAGSVLPAGLSGTTGYLAVRRNSFFFSITNLDGTAVTLADAGSGLLYVLEDLEPTILQMLGRRASDVQSAAKAYKPPYTDPVPLTLVGCAVDLTTFDVATRMRVATPRFSLDDVRKKYDAAQLQLERLDRGEPLAETVADATPGTLEPAALAWAAPPRHIEEGLLR